MNKTVTVNIGGMVFHIEEQAYDKLRRYLDAIRGYFTSSEGRDEIIQDIESRIAEVFTDRIGTSRQVVTDADVDAMIDTMGRPEQVAGADDEANGSQDKNSSFKGDFGKGADPFQKGYRKLYRDNDDKVVGGVCSGISHYLGMDPIWMRLIFAVAFFGYGTGFLVYLLLLIIIPKAKTTAEKLEMKGQPVNIDNIRRTIEEEVDDIRSRINGGSPFVKRSSSGIARFFEALGEILVGALRIIGKFLGIVMIFVLSAVLFALFMALLAITGVLGGATIPIYMTELFLTPTQLVLACIALGLVIGIPVIALLYSIIRSLFNIQAKSRVLNVTSGVLMAIGIILAFYVGSGIAREVKGKDSNNSTLPIQQPAGDTLFLERLDLHDGSDENDNNGIFIDTDSWTVGAEGDTIHFGMVELDVRRALGSNFELEKITRSRGRDRRDAENNIKAVEYKIEQRDSLLLIDDNYKLKPGSKFRSQSIKLILYVPDGKSVYLGSGMGDVIYDIKNTTNTYDLDMIGHTWTMTSRGLECVGCNLDPSTSLDWDGGDSERHTDDSKVDVRVNGKKVGKNDKDTINWDNKDVKISINKHGVMIDAKDKR